MNQTTHRSFLLHDGESDEKTTEMHEFLEQPVNLRGHDWEGHNSGIYIQLDVAQGDTIVVIGDGAFLILRKAEKVKITWPVFPMVWRAIREIEFDSGAHHVNRICGPGTVDMDTFSMPYDYGVDKLVAAENALFNFEHRFGVDAFNEFCTGDQAVQEKNVAENPEMGTASALLNAWFNGWTE